VQIAVPRSMIGVVIGKGGEMIKKIQQESGARIQFRPEDELGGPNRMCNITGSQEQTQAAHNMIQELVDNTAVCYITATICMSLCVCLSVIPVRHVHRCITFKIAVLMHSILCQDCCTYLGDLTNFNTDSSKKHLRSTTTSDATTV